MIERGEPTCRHLKVLVIYKVRFPVRGLNQKNVSIENERTVLMDSI